MIGFLGIKFDIIILKIFFFWKIIIPNKFNLSNIPKNLYYFKVL